jgi:hypothetical protein
LTFQERKISSFSPLFFFFSLHLGRLSRRLTPATGPLWIFSFPFQKETKESKKRKEKRQERRRWFGTNWKEKTRKEMTSSKQNGTLFRPKNRAKKERKRERSRRRHNIKILLLLLLLLLLLAST